MIKLNSMSDISISESLAEQFESHLMVDADITIDASEVERVDTSVLQLLVSASITLTRNDHQLTISNPSNAFLSTCDLLDLSKYLYINAEPPEKGELK